MRDRLGSPEVKQLANRLSSAYAPDDLLIAINTLNASFYGMGAIVSLPTLDPDPRFHPFVYPSSLPDECVPYFYYPNVYSITRQPLELPPCRPDWSIIFDSNFAGCIDRFVRGKSLNNSQESVTRIIDTIIRHDLNFDPSFYIAENIKQVSPIISGLRPNESHSPDKFWESLDNGFRQNLVSLQLFRDFDQHHYLTTGEFKSRRSIESATDSAIKLANWFYIGEGKDLASEILFHQQIILVLLLITLRVQFECIGDASDKLQQLVTYMQEKAVYFDREAVLAYKYFKDRDTIPLLATMNRGAPPRDLMSKLDNLAWDLAAPRYMEMMIRFMPPPGSNSFVVPFFLSLDKKLRDAIGSHPVRFVIIDWNSRQLIPIPLRNTLEYFRAEGCEIIVRELSSIDKSKQRLRREPPSSETLSNMISDEYDRLARTLA